ncbi:MAG: pyridoxal-phosphate dependent enzyme [Thermodesulfobacteriota bacterium]
MHEQNECPVSLTEVLRAKKVICQHLVPTPLTRYEELSRLLGAEIYIKHENHNPTGTFKVRGGVNVMHHLKQREIDGVITFSTGNHGLSVATSASWFGIDASIVVPKNNNPAKNRKIRAAGGQLIEAGTTFEEAAQLVEEMLAKEDLYYVHPANEPHLINGVGTEFLEIMEVLPDLEAMIIPIGAGSEAAAACMLPAFQER